MFQTVFKRYEKKYRLTKEQYGEVLNLLSYNAVPDEYGESDICSIYYDTQNKLLIRRSLDKPVYKEKLRVRTYGIPKDSSTCFIELKKKYKGIVYKRRIETDYKNALLFMSGSKNNIRRSQIKDEIDYFKDFYGDLVPSACVSYKRRAYYDRLHRNIRFTFDSDIICRDYDLDLKSGIYGERIIPKDEYVMEIKTDGAVPSKLAKLLSELKIYPDSFSKYGTVYLNSLNKKDTLLKGGEHCA